MTIKIDYWLRENGIPPRVMSATITEAEILECLEQKFRNGDLPCPMNFNRELVSVEFSIESVTV